MFVVGLTGGAGSGKSTVCRMFQQLGCIIIDADYVAREGNTNVLNDCSYPQRRPTMFNGSSFNLQYKPLD